MDRKRVLCGLAFIAATTIAPPVSASATQASIQSHESIRQVAEAFIANEVQASYGVAPQTTAGRLDSRLRLGQCDQRLEGFIPSSGRTLGNVTVGVRCNGNKPWTLYVPVKVSVMSPVVVTARPKSRGEIIQKSDVKLAHRDLAQLRGGYFTAITEVAGSQTTRSMTLGMVINTNMVKTPRQVKRGQRVNLIAESGALQVRMSGVAMTDGAKGEIIQVRNLSTKRIVEGTILSATTIRVNL